jgi:hypothetical protein
MREKNLQMVQTKICQITPFQNLILYKNYYGNLQVLLEMATLLKYLYLYLTNEWGRFYVVQPYMLQRNCDFVSSVSSFNTLGGHVCHQII